MIKAEQDPDYYFDAVYTDRVGYKTVRGIHVHAPSLELAQLRARGVAMDNRRNGEAVDLTVTNEERFYSFPLWQRDG